MDISKKTDRAPLKAYFAKNAVPTAGNFADLIDAMINQKEDGIAKLAGEPLSIQADGNSTSQMKAINFYKNFSDPRPAWSLSLNPRSDPSNAATAKPGWSIGDADGNSKLFIDETTGNVGIGTVAPVARLSVNGVAVFSNGNDYAVRNKFMAPGSVTIGSLDANYGGGSQWNANTAGLLLETLANTEIAVNDAGTRLASLLYYEGDSVNRVTIGRDMGYGPVTQVLLNGSVSIGTTERRALLNVCQGTRTNLPGHPAAVKGLYVTGDFGQDADGVEFRHSNGTQGIGFGYNTIYATGSSATQDLNLKTRSGTVNITGAVVASGAIHAGNSDLYFTNTNHQHTGFGNTQGFSAIENVTNYDGGTLMILGRSVPQFPILPFGGTGFRRVSVWDMMIMHGIFVNQSDAREKKDVSNLQYGLREVRQLRPVLYNWKDIYNPHKCIGLIAQEVLPVLGEAVYMDEHDPDAHLSIAYTSLVPVLINAIKELADTVDQLSGRAHQMLAVESP